MKRLDVAIASELTRAGERRTMLQFNGAARGDIFWHFRGDLIPAEPGDLDFALVAVLPFAMHHGFDLHLRGALNRDLVEGVEECMDVWTLWRPDVFRHRVGIDADDIRDATAQPGRRDAVLTFSGGVDATFALVANQKRMLGRRSVDVVAGVMIHGFDLPLERRDWFAPAAAHARAIAQAQGVGFTAVESDWRRWSVDWAMGHAFGLFAVLHQFHGRTAGGVLAADVDYHEMLHAWGNNSLTNHFLSGAGFPVQISGAGYTRTEKVAAIARLPAVREHLRVCWEHPELGGNCGRCEKCVRTQLNFVAAGAGRIPAFPRPLTAEMILAIGCKNEGQRRFLEATLEHRDGAALPPEIRAAVRHVIGRPLRRAGVLRRLRERLRVRQRIRLALAR